jgi:hypothetical protein
MFVIEHDSNAWICKLQAITLREEAGYEVLWGGAGEGEGGVACLGMDWGILEVFSYRAGPPPAPAAAGPPP